eukprot:1912681-Amphidinium_carterae.1
MKALDRKFVWIVDDASHQPAYTVKTFEYFRQHLEKSGVYIIEDVNFDLLAWFERLLDGQYAIYVCRHSLQLHFIVHKDAEESLTAQLMADTSSWRVLLEPKGGMKRSAPSHV